MTPVGRPPQKIGMKGGLATLDITAGCDRRSIRTNLFFLPPDGNKQGGYCIQITSGNCAWAYFAPW